MPTPKRFASWAGVSSLPQAKLISLEDQLRTNRAHVERHGGQIVAELIVPGESRNIILFEDAARKMDAYAKLKQLIDERAIDVLIYLDRSRLGRKASLSMAVVELCHEAGIICYETDAPPVNLDGIHNSYDDLLIGAIKSVGAQQELAKLNARRASGMRGRIERGEFPGDVPWGWLASFDRDGKRIVEVDPVAATIIREILLDMFLRRGLGRPHIASELNRRGVLAPRGGQWDKAQIANIFSMATRYAGWSEYNRRKSSKSPYLRTQGRFPAILSQPEYEAVLAERKVRRSARRTVYRTYRFSLCVWCKRCNRRMVISVRSGEYVQMRCPTLHTEGYTTERQLVRVVRTALEALQDTDYRRQLAQETAANVEPLQAQISQHTNAIAALNAALLRLDDEYFAGTFSKDVNRYRRQSERLQAAIADEEERIKEVYAQIALEQDASRRGERIEESYRQGLAMLDEPDVRIANAWFRTHLRIWLLARKQVHIEYV